MQSFGREHREAVEAEFCVKEDKTQLGVSGSQGYWQKTWTVILKESLPEAKKV
jgi:hypothetical protein